MTPQTVQSGPSLDTEALPEVGDVFVLREQEGGGWQVHCAACDHAYGPADRDPKLGAVVREGTITDLSLLNAEGLGDRLVARQFCCPSCALLIAVNVQQHGDPIMLEWRLDPATLAAATEPVR